MEVTLNEASLETPATLYRRPGFLARRLHQAATAMFASECEQYGVTQLQYGALALLNAEPHLDQITLGKRLGLDRSTIGMVVRNLEEHAYIARAIDPQDTRRRTMTITGIGRDLLEKLLVCAQRAQERLLESLAPDERASFIEMLVKLTSNLNPLMPSPVEEPDL